MDIKEYKCPNCGGAVKFNSGTQKMKCPYCDAEFEIGALDGYQKDLSAMENAQKVSDGDTIKIPGEGANVIVKGFRKVENHTSDWKEDELVDLSTGSCPSCGSELVGDENTIATVCPCCGNSQIVKKRVQGMLKPESVIPFQLEKESATEALKKFYQGKKLLPDYFKEQNQVNGIQALYVPFWLYDAKAGGSIRYKATKVRSWSDNSYNYTETKYFSIIRDGSINFSKIPVDGSKKMDNEYMDAVEPFDYNKLKDFQTSYLSGYIAEKYDVDAEESKTRAAKRITCSIESQFANSVKGYSSVNVENSVVNVDNVKSSYALFPVWIVNTKYQNQDYQFIMNGQSGKIVGRLPVDKGKERKYKTLFTAGISLVLTFIILMLRMFM